MSDAYGGPGWWLANDGKWYPPTDAAGAAPTDCDHGDFEAGDDLADDVLIDLTTEEPTIYLTPPPVPGSSPRPGIGRDRPGLHRSAGEDD